MANFKNSLFFPSLFQRKGPILLMALLTIAVAAIVAISFSSSKVECSSSNLVQRAQTPSPSISAPPLLHSLIKKACTTTIYSSLCLATLSSIPAAASDGISPSLHHILEFAINDTRVQVERARRDILARHFSSRDRDFEFKNSLEKNAMDDCLEMLDQTLYELGEAIEDLHSLPSFSPSYHLNVRSYNNVKTLLSAAMTNENSCVDGFSDLEELDQSPRMQEGLKDYLQNLLSPISRRISNCLAIIKYMENMILRDHDLIKNPRMLLGRTRFHGDKFQDWMRNVDRKMMETSAGGTTMSPNVTVAPDGSGNFSRIGDAIAAAPNSSLNCYVIKINAGVYRENVVIPREKSNIMLMGKGMNSTIISGARNFLDGFSTFASATMTVIGDKFLARDLTVINTSGPEKHQAVALRVTSNAAFYRCQMISYQDTLYAHSLRQFYRECSIHGTIDFIFGNAAAIFQNCVILVRKPAPGQNNMVTAQGRGDPNQNTGISLQNCTVTAAPESRSWRNVSTFLGRPWRNYSRTIIMKSYLGDLVHPQGWCKWNEYSTLDTVDYIEYLNFGPGSDTRHRVRWSGYRKNCSEDEARQFSVGAFLHGADDWLESTVFPLFMRSTNTTSRHHIPGFS